MALARHGAELLETFSQSYRARPLAKHHGSCGDDDDDDDDEEHKKAVCIENQADRQMDPKCPCRMPSGWSDSCVFLLPRSGEVRPSDPPAPGASGTGLPDAEQSISGEAGAAATQTGRKRGEGGRFRWGRGVGREVFSISAAVFLNSGFWFEHFKTCTVWGSGRQLYAEMQPSRTRTRPSSSCDSGNLFRTPNGSLQNNKWPMQIDAGGADDCQCAALRRADVGRPRATPAKGHRVDTVLVGLGPFNGPSASERGARGIEAEPREET